MLAYFHAVTTGRLTRQELGWLLAQEARGAARTLRQDVALLSVAPPPLAPSAAPAQPRVETTLNALDDAIDLLTQLEHGPTAQKTARRGRLDVAAVLWELAPYAAVSIEPGAGTEVFGDEADLRRMLHVLLTQTNHQGGQGVSIRREGDWVRVSAELGPDAAAGTEIERRWLGRMATRMGGRLDLEGGTMSLRLPADASTDLSEVADLRKELEQAQQLGEAYARELASVLTASAPAAATAEPEDATVATRRLDAVVSFARGTHATLRALFRALRADVDALPDGPAAQTLREHASSGHELVAELARLASCPQGEQETEEDLARLALDAVGALDARAARHGVRVEVAVGPDIRCLVRPEATRLLVRSLLDHAIAATPRAGIVSVTARVEDGAVALRVTDGGVVVPTEALHALLKNSADPASLGRPPGPALLTAGLLAASLGAPLELAESPGTGLVATVRLTVA